KLRQAFEREQQTLYWQQIALAERELAAHNVGRAEELLHECPARLRGWEWHYLKRLPDDPPRVMRTGNTWVLSLAYSPDGRTLATSSLAQSGLDLWFLGKLPWWQARVQVWDAATGRELYSLPKKIGLTTALAFSPDGGHLATAGLDSVVTLW